MNLKLKLAFMLLVSVAVTYTACKKLDDGSPQVLSTKAVSSQVALNIAQTLYSGFGIFNISNGLSAPSNLGLMPNRGHKLNDINVDPGCGLTIDTTLNYSASIGDTAQASIAGRIKFSFLCSNGVASGITVNDNLTVSEIGSTLDVSYMLGENLTLQTLNPQDDNSKLSLNGNVDISDKFQYKTGSKQTTSESYNYVFTSLLIDPLNNGDIASGSATFSTKGSNASGVWNYSGTIVFLGNFTAKITINGTAYTVNLQTGQVTG